MNLDELMDRSTQPVAEPDTLDDAMDAYIGGQVGAVRAGATLAMDSNPDEIARQKRIAQSLGVPLAAVEADPAFATREQRMRSIEQATANSPALRAKFSDADFAKLAGDNVENLSAIERTMRQFFGSYGENIGRKIHGTGESLNILQRRATSGFADLFLPEPWGGGKPTEESLAGPLAGKEIGKLGMDTMQYYRNNVLLPQGQRTFGDEIVGGLGQVLAQITTFPVDRGTSLYAEGVSIVSEKVANDPATQAEKDWAMLGGGAVTGLTEKWALDKMLGPLAVPIKNAFGAAAARIGIASVAEGAQEFYENLLHEGLRKRLTNESVELDPAQAGVEAEIGAVVGGVVRAITESAFHIKTRMTKVDQAEKSSEFIGNLNQLAAADKLLQRDADSFEQFVAAASEDGPVDTVYVDGRMLMQSGMSPKLAEMSPSVREQLDMAILTGGDIAIPVAEYAARIAPTELAPQLLDHIKTEADGFTRAEAADYMANIGADLQAEVERVMGTQADADTFRASQDVVKQDILGQLNTAGRFTPQVNEAYATLASAYSAVRAAQLGMTPEEFHQQRGMKVQGAAVAGQQFSQSFDGSNDSFFTKGLADGLPADAEFVSELAKTRTFKEFGLRGFDVPSQRIVMSRVLGVLQDDKVRQRIVELVPVDVVDILRSEQLTPEMLFNDMAMLSDLLTVDGDKSVPFSVDASRVLVDRITSLVAEHAPGRLDGGLGSGDWLAASVAGAGNDLADGLDIAGVAAEDLAALADMGRVAGDSGSAGGAGIGTQGDSPSTEYRIAYDRNSGLSTIETFDPADPNILNQSATIQPGGNNGQSGRNPDVRPGQAEQELDTTVAGEPAAEGWAGATRIRGKSGEPVTVYRGAAVPLDPGHFAAESLGSASGNPSSGLGVWFTTGRDEAANYGNVEPARLDIRNPKVIKVEELPGFDSVADAYAFRENLRAEGYDGIVITGRHLGKQEAHIVAFEPQQVVRQARVFNQSQDGSVALRALADEGNNQAILAQALVDRAGFGPKQFADVLEGAALGTQPDGLVSVPAFASMLSHMRSAVLDDLKVLDAIVGSVPVDMVNNLTGSESAAKVLLHDEAMNEDSPAFNADLVVANGVDTSNPVVLLVREAALAAAKVASVTLNNGRESSEAGAAILAGDGNSFSQSARLPRAAFHPSTNTITLLDNADLTSFLHESAHYFFESDINLASELLGKARGTERKLLTDAAAPVADGYVRLYRAESPAVSFDDVFEREGLEHFARPDGMRGQRYTDSKKVADYYRSSYGNDAKIYYVDVLADRLDSLRVADSEYIVEPTEATSADLTFGEQQIIDDVHKLLTWHGIQGDINEQIRQWHNMDFEEQRSHHERTAESFEAYLFSGKSPSLELQPVFQRFASWMLNVYKSLKDFLAKNPEAGKLNDEVRQVFDRMIATREEIALAEQARSMMPLFSSPETSGVDPEEYAKIQAQHAEATATAVDELQAKGMRDLQWLKNAKGKQVARLKRESKALRSEVEIESRREVMSQPVYRAWDFLTGKADEKTEVGQGEQVFGKFNRAALEDMGIPDEIVGHIRKLRMTAVDGMAPDLVATMFEFSSGDELVRTIAAAQSPKEAITELADRLMLERHGELATPEAIELAADAAIHNDARARMVATEYNALAKATGERKLLTAAAKEYAAQIIARLKIRDIRPSQYANAETRAAKAAMKASSKGDLATAAAEKRNQVINIYATRAAYDAKDDVAAGLRYLKKFDKRSKTIDPEYQDQIEAMLERFELRAISNKDVDRRTSLAQWLTSQREAGLEPDIDPKLENEAFRTSYKNITVEEFRGLVDAVKQIEHLGRLKNKLLTAQDQRAFKVIVDEISASIIDNGGKARPVQLETPKGIRPWLEGVAAGHRKMASLIRQMDGLKDGGPFWRVLVRGMNEASTNETVMIEQASEKLAELYKPMLALKGGLNGDLRSIPEIGDSLTRGGRLSVALNWGNAANRQRVMDGDQWSEYQVNAILKTLTREEWAFVQNVWTFIDSYWPAIEAKEKRVTGRAPDKVAAEPFTYMVNGEMVSLTGGYYPIKYDSNRDDRAEKHDAAAIAQDMMRGAMTRSTTRRGHTKARMESVNRPVKKTLDVITQHVSEVTHDLAWHEWLVDANRLLDAKPINQAIRDYYGTEVLRTMKDALTSIATADIIPQDAIDRALLYLRANVSRSTMGLSLTTAFLQPFGLLQSMVRIGPKPVLRGMARWAGDATRFESSITWIAEKSDFMRLRSKTFNRELHEIKGRVSHGHSKARMIYDASLFMLMQKMQMVADVPTWIGAYEKALADNQDDATSVALADQAVLDSQGGGQTKDMSAFQKKHPFMTMFYSYFNTTLNLAAESTAATNFKNPLAVAGWASDMALLMVIPALGPAMILALMKGEDCEGEECAVKLARAQAGYLMNLMLGVRELSGITSGFDYAGPPVGRVITEIERTATQVGQGEADEAAAMATIRMFGVAFGIPTTQILRSYRGWKAWDEDDAPATSILLGPPQKD